MRRLAPVIVVLVAAAVLATAAGAAVLGVTSGRIAVFSKTLTHGSCTLPGTAVSDDAYTIENSADSNQNGTTLSLSPRTSRHQYAWIKFNLAGCALPAGAQVDSATLTLQMTASMNGRTISVSEATGAWAEGTLTWNTQPAVAATPTDTFSGTGTGTKTVDVGPDVADWVSGVATNYGWRLADLGASQNVTGTIVSSEGPTANRPTLTIAYGS